MGSESLMDLMGDPHEVRVERALAEIRSGRPVLLSAAGADYLVMSPETVDDEALAAIRAASKAQPQLVLSRPRLRLLGHKGDDAGIIPVKGMNAAEIHALVAHTDIHLNGHAPKPAGEADKAALDLVRLAYLLPAAIVVEMRQEPNAPASTLVRVEVESVKHYREHVLTSPRIVSRAPVPLDDIGETEFVVFRGGEGMRDQVAVVIGKPKPGEPVYARLHSACLTGDLFGSLKCDCGDQLRGTVKFMAENGGGVLLYLDQEGRGNGIANKIRAYRLQHAGYNTFDADEILGFDHDQRRFDFAAAMLKQLGYQSIRLLTNNPAKVEALQAAGLDVVSSHRAKARFTLQNVGYLAAKRDHAGHMIEEDLKY
ncbi:MULTISPECIES: GTP cyclohydrolase II RibA [Rhodomicrobium]|uniref:GTP cyclohydrolase II RibA n=1 Tax=Rhodomicrobium TaxID=1068 RepID=UPI001FD903A5|nr:MULTISPECIES: GTP cyclohydrolase II RibA [Rhodomicrobium]